MIFHDAFQYDTTAPNPGPFGFFAYSGNNLHHPNWSNPIAKQPPGFKQLMTLYDRYRVHASKIEITFFPYDEPVQPQTIRATIVPLEDITGYPATQNFADYPHSRTGFIQSLLTGSQCTLSNTMHTKKILATKDIIDDPTYQYSGVFTTDPPKQWWWMINLNNFSGMGQVRILWQVKITYYTEYFNRADIYQPSEGPVEPLKLTNWDDVIEFDPTSMKPIPKEETDPVIDYTPPPSGQLSRMSIDSREPPRSPFRGARK
jgi:hypothetical protein